MTPENLKKANKIFEKIENSKTEISYLNDTSLKFEININIIKGFSTTNTIYPDLTPAQSSRILKLILKHLEENLEKQEIEFKNL